MFDSTFVSNVFIALSITIVVSGKPNFVVILTDDQNLDLKANGWMPLTNVMKHIANQGKIFTNAFANTPVCCPSRSTILTGKYAHNTGVVNNSIPGNCSSTVWQKQHEPYSLASILHSNGYRTFYAGKYLNNYGHNAVGGTKHVPKGYDWWVGLKGNSKYYNYTLSINGSATFFGNQYLTDVIADYAEQFLNQRYIVDTPFFMMLATPAPHAPFTPAPRHANMFPKVKAVRTPSFNYTPVDKHWLLQMPPTSLPSDVEFLDNTERSRLQTLLAVDEMVLKVIDKLKELKILSETYIIFMSDHGFHIGQFSQILDKRQPYETDIRIPFFIKGPNVPRKSVDYYPIMNVDITPTILDLANIKTETNFDGNSFKQRLMSKKRSFSGRNIFVEYWGESNPNTIDADCPWTYDKNVSLCYSEQLCKCQDSRNNTYSCAIKFSPVKQFKYCKFLDDNHFVEAYDLLKDPYELRNIAKYLDSETTNEYETLLHKFKTCVGNECKEI